MGAVVEEQLNQVGITTYDQLKETGSKQAWLKIKAIDESACINRLYGLEGTIRGIKKSQLSPEVKAELKEFYDHCK
ncbi:MULTISPECIES: TfoX/Sxy family protein [Blautia]|uniref:TfoX/Sxy family protein n=1 Tax=Blautia TaxID=572511 RepID=UPI00210B8C65|nr:TfoX/Sxy family protein [Blautia sp.]MCQ4745296.1 TfoX/Sxy family protein [Blautia producta]